MEKWKHIEDMSVEDVRKMQEEILNTSLRAITALDFLKDSNTEVTYNYNELEGVCPMTGLPDNYELKIIWTPNKYIPELKSLRLYFIEYRDLPILHEHLINKIYDDFFRAVKPLKLRVEINVAVRGGISTRLVKGGFEIIDEFPVKKHEVLIGD